MSTPTEKCSVCKEASTFVEDNHTGDRICSSCGAIQQERIISEEAEYRIFSDDSESKNKIRVGAAYNPLQEYSLTQKSTLHREDKEFLWEGLKNVDDTIFRLCNGDTTNKAVAERAKELFQKAFYRQMEQKKGNLVMKKASGPKTTNGGGIRKKFSKRKQYVVSCIYQALTEEGLSAWNIATLSNLVEGEMNVSQSSVDTCLEEIGLKTGSSEVNPTSPVSHDEMTTVS